MPINKKLLTRDLQLLYCIGTFRGVPRQWKKFHMQDVANVVEHIMRVRWIAKVIAHHEGITDPIMLLQISDEVDIHDLPENIHGDQDHLGHVYTTHDSIGALSAIVDGTSLESSVKKTFRQYELRNTIVSKIVKDADTLDAEMELKELEFSGHHIRQEFKKKYKHKARKRLHTNTAKILYNLICKSNPMDWYHVAETRYSKGKKQKV